MTEPESGPFASRRHLRWARKQADLAHLRFLMAENQRALDEIERRNAEGCRLRDAMEAVPDGT